jgi:hypothetical protein
MSATSVLDPPAGGLRLDVIPLERLEAEITTLTGQISAATCQLLLAIAAYDRREGWAKWECRSMTHWLAWQTALSPAAAREHVRVAHALEGLPVVRDAFSAGRLSYSQVRALTRVAVPSTEPDLVDLARSMTASQLDRLVARYRGVRAATTDTAQARRARRGLADYLDDDGTRVIVIRLPAEDGERVVRVIDAAAQAAWQARRNAPAAPEPGIDPQDDESLPARRADAVVELIERAGRADPNPSGDPDRTLLVLHVHAEVLAHDEPDGACHLEHGAAIAPDTARRLGCGSATLTAADHPDGSTVLGRRSRRVPPAMRRALAMRDPTCVFPGCDTIAGNELHHVRHWAHGGPTTPENLASLCRFHHHRLHEGGYHMRPEGQGPRWIFTRPDGQPIPDVWDPPKEERLPAACREIGPNACVPQWDGLGVDHNWIIESLLQTEGLLEPATAPFTTPGRDIEQRPC